MIERNEYIQLKAYARQYGAFMGLAWIAIFACFIGTVFKPALSIAFDIGIIMIPILAHFFVKRYRDGIIGGFISFRRAFFFSMLIFIYASLLLGIAQWAYFQFIDGGRLVGELQKVLVSPEFKPVIDAYSQNGIDLSKQMDVLSTSRPIDFAFTFMWFNFIAGTFVSFVVALFLKKTKQ